MSSKDPKLPFNTDQAVDYIKDLSQQENWVFASAAISWDGKLKAGSGFKPFGGSYDSKIYRTLRQSAQATIIGANTVRASKKTSGKDHPGFKNVPVILSRSLYFEDDTQLFSTPQKAFLYTTPQPNAHAVKKLSEGNPLLVIKSGFWPAQAILEDLKKKGYSRVLVDGGGSIYSMFSEYVQDWFLTKVPVLSGNDEPLFWGPQAPNSANKFSSTNELEIVYSFTEGNRVFNQLKNNSAKRF